MTQSDRWMGRYRSRDPRVATGRITAEPNPLREEGATLQLSWEVNAEQAEVHVSVDGKPEKLLAQAVKDSVALDWIRPGARYVFRLYGFLFLFR